MLLQVCACICAHMVGSVGRRAEVARAPSDLLVNSLMTVGSAWRLLCRIRQWPWVTGTASYQWTSGWKLKVAKVKGMPLASARNGDEHSARLGRRVHLYPSLFSLA